jgi:hypothetical protein
MRPQWGSGDLGDTVSALIRQVGGPGCPGNCRVQCEMREVASSLGIEGNQTETVWDEDVCVKLIVIAQSLSFEDFMS